MDLLAFSGEISGFPESLDLDIDQHSIINDEVVHVRHIPDKSQIEVSLRGSRCPEPVLRGRLSGAVVSLLGWHREGSVLVGKYNVPYTGRYFVEIIVLMCHGLQSNSSTEEVMDTCVEDVRRHRITALNSSIYVSSPIRHQISTSTGKLGYWVLRNGSQAEFMKTRVQPNGLHHLDVTKTEYTKQPPFRDYEFVLLSPDFRLPPVQCSPKLPATVKRKVDERICSSMPRKLCFIGASHSRTAAKLLGNLAEHIPCNWPSGLASAGQQALSMNCTDIVIGIGQWPAGYPDGFMNFTQYYESMHDGLKNVTTVIQYNATVTVRTVHENPLNHRNSACPPDDWRNPEVIRIYNQLLARLCKELNVTLLDTSDIIQPFWDTAEDWCHYANSVGKAEAHFIAHILAYFD